MTTADWWQCFVDWAAGPLAPGPNSTARASDAFLDTAACIFAGFAAPVTEAVARAAPAADPAITALRLGTAAHALDFDDTAIRRAEVVALARRVRLVPSATPQGPGGLMAEDPDILTLTLVDEQVIERRLAPLPGSRESPTTREALHTKLADCAAGRLAPSALDRSDPASMAGLLDQLPALASLELLMGWIDRARP